jgi:NO-binding membrane sensor protein with MHYT domain
VSGVSHETWIVLLSILVAIQGSYVALGLTLKVSRSVGTPRRINLAAAALTFAVSIWSMHFIGILALRLPIPLHYLVLPTLLSFLLCVFVVGAAVLIASYEQVWRFAVPLAALMMGLGIATMHYVGMLALHNSALMHHNPVYVAASFGVAIVASALGLHFAFAPHRTLPVAPAAVLFGLAISGMHYIAMEGMTLAPLADNLPPKGTVAEAALSSDLLAVIVTLMAFAVSAIFLLTLVPDHGPVLTVPQLGRDDQPPTHTAPVDPSMHPAGVAEIARLPSFDAALPVERGGVTHYIPVEMILLVRADAHYTSVFDGKTHSFCRLSIGEVEGRLDPGRFLRVHRSYLIAIDRITTLHRNGDGGTARFDTPDPISVPVSRARYSRLKARLRARA